MKYVATLVCVLQFWVGYATQVRAVVSTQSLPIGDQFMLGLEAVCSPNEKISFPVVVLPNGLEIVAQTEIQKVAQGANVVYTQNFDVTAFEAKKFVLPAFVFTDVQSGATYSTKPKNVEFLPVMLQKNDLIYDIKGILPVKYTLKALVPLFIFTFLVVAIAAFFWLKPKAKPKAKPTTSLRQKRLTPYENALQTLEILERNQFWTQNTKEYHSRIVEILHIYLQAEFGITTHEATSNQILGQLKPKITAANLSQIETIYQLSDSVKYAKATPSAENNFLHLKQTKVFILNCYDQKHNLKNRNTTHTTALTPK